MNASDLVATYRRGLIGMRVQTMAMGAYPGGPATIVDVQPDANAPEIVLTVRHDTWRSLSAPDGKIGVFDYEEISLLTPDDHAQPSAQ